MIEAKEHYTSLIADIGGTNARLALARGGEIERSTMVRYRNDDFAAFDDVLRAYLDRHPDRVIDAVSIAVAGPVSDGRASLTNRDWYLDVTRLSQWTGASRVRLLNDLNALGYAVPALATDGFSRLRSAPDDRPHNGQMLVVGLGTGFNICAVFARPGRPVVALEAEEGHTSLPTTVFRRLHQVAGPEAGSFRTAEDLFSGAGLARLHGALTNRTGLRGEDVFAAAANGDSAANTTYDLFAELLGLHCRELALRFIPSEGLYLAGSVGRSIAARIGNFEAGFLAEPHMRHIPENVPIFLIEDDMAALQGCLAALS